ncbi:NAD(P)-binding protein [Martensiomyces pterosporus]|nr:NAD(P)-binding protein [Martensiomyces pterosporus]
MSANRVAIVTGASRGIGKAVALHLISKGVSVVGVARSADAISSTSQEANKLSSTAAKFIPVVGDVTDDAVQQSAIDHATEQGTLVALVNNAGIIDPIGPISSAPIGLWTAQLQINFVAPFSFIQKVLPLLRPVHGRIINVSSAISHVVFPNYAIYGASKAALNQATRVLAAEEPEITALAIHPGVVETQIYAAVVDYRKRASSSGGQKVSSTPRPPSIAADLPGTIIGNLALRADHSLSGQYVMYDQPEIANGQFIRAVGDVTDEAAQQASVGETAKQCSSGSCGQFSRWRSRESSLPNHLIRWPDTTRLAPLHPLA